MGFWTFGFSFIKQSHWAPNSGAKTFLDSASYSLLNPRMPFPFVAYGVNDPACTLHAVSFTPHAKFANSNLYAKRLYPLNQGSKTDVLLGKNCGGGVKIVALSL
jgi:hypothetical protein